MDVLQRLTIEVLAVSPLRRSILARPAPVGSLHVHIHMWLVLLCPGSGRAPAWDEVVLAGVPSHSYLFYASRTM